MSEILVMLSFRHFAFAALATGYIAIASLIGRTLGNSAGSAVDELEPRE